MLDDDQFPEHLRGLSKDITRTTYRYTPGLPPNDEFEEIARNQYESSYELPPQRQDPSAFDYIVPKTPENLEMEALFPSCAAEPSHSHAAAQLSLPDLAPSGSDDDVPFSPSRPIAQVYEISPRLDESAIWQSDAPELASWFSGEDVAPSPLGSLGATDGYKLDSPAVMGPSRLEAAPPTSTNTALASPTISPEEEDDGFTTVHRNKHKLGERTNSWTRRQVDAYQGFQAEFQSAFAASPVLEQDRKQFTDLFEPNPHTQQMQAKTNKIIPAAKIAHHSAVWTPKSKKIMMDALWWTIFHRERAGMWYANLDPRDSRIEKQEGHRHFLEVLKKAWRIFSDGVVFDRGSQPT
jgi:hypothetical protein